MSIVVTGGAGFIGSNLISYLNDRGISNIIIVDNISTSSKWKNLIGKKYSEYIHKNVFLSRLNEFKDITHIIHLGACSSTSECDFDYLWNNNIQYSKILFDFCVKNNISFIYASSAATYGSGEYGFSDNLNNAILKPLNRYGYSKQLFDIWVDSQENKPIQCVGLKFFNVFGPNENHKDKMSSIIKQAYEQILKQKKVFLFKSNINNLKDGEQKRDFIYVKDVCKIIDFFMKNSKYSGIYNVGTGVASTFNEVINILFEKMDVKNNIEYIDIPLQFKKTYQNYTQADISKLRAIGYQAPFYSIKDAVDDYLHYLRNED